MTPTSDNGITMIRSHHSVDGTVERLQAVLQAKGVKLFDLIEHSSEAKIAGMSMRPTKL